MSKIPRFLLCTNPMYSEPNLFILSTGKPSILIRVNNPDEKTFSLTVEKVYADDFDDTAGVLARARDWFVACKNSGLKF